jgi:hypothetical protein
MMPKVAGRGTWNRQAEAGIRLCEMRRDVDIEPGMQRSHQKEHFVNYFLTCYVLPGNDLRPVG